ncbi:leucine-rich repeat extensin-like protein 5 isoform X2 [Drosophila subpulchrella]|uniref:leucine-rich repeat extensin-like protein 5 isoform X2 n=1 Tax=Drosophila subpulchrella TaxID=1486046 RepID=UPI0018A19E74|nr:leucine-rich repeat extensin-like protein 5 isoform X2 [Drosophila subpulchrella]
MAKKTTYKMPEPSCAWTKAETNHSQTLCLSIFAKMATHCTPRGVGIFATWVPESEETVPLERNPKASTENIKKKMAQPEQTDQPGTSSKVSTQAPKLLAKEASQEPGSSKGPMQPTWRDDQVGLKADLKTTGAEQDKPKIRAGPSKPVAPPVTPTTSGAGPSQRTPSTAKKPRLNAKASKPVVPPVTPTTSAAAPPQRTPSTARKPRSTAKSSKPVAPPATPTTSGADSSQRTPTVVKKPRTRIVQQK